MKKYFIISLALLSIVSITNTFAATTPAPPTILTPLTPASTLLPATDNGFGPIIIVNGKKQFRCQNLASKIKDGNIKISDISCYGLYFTEFIISISASIAVILIIFGGYQYMLSELAGEKAKGLNTIKFALIGMVLSSMAWIIVKAVQTFWKF